jgi:hypothetical protein
LEDWTRSVQSWVAHSAHASSFKLRAQLFRQMSWSGR